jgi:hypothetical protein
VRTVLTFGAAFTLVTLVLFEARRLAALAIPAVGPSVLFDGYPSSVFHR